MYADTVSGPGYAQAVGATQLLANNTYYVVGTYDGSTTTVYVNGVIDAQITAAGAGSINYASIAGIGLGIGSSANNTDRSSFNGLVGFVAIYPRALTAAQIKNHYTVSGNTALASKFPTHIQTWAYYESGTDNSSVSATTMAHVDFAENTDGSSNLTDAFINAGGRFALTYTDPHTVPYCGNDPSTTCNGTLGSTVPES